MDTTHREVFFNMMLGIQLLYHEGFGTRLEGKIMHVMMEILYLSREYGDEEEGAAIQHNVTRIVLGKKPIDIDECAERYKLYKILGDTDLTYLIPPEDK